MVKYLEVTGQTRGKLAERIAEEINKHGIADRVIGIYSSGASDGKFAGGGLFGKYIAYVYYKS